jgi:hypothetical protein
MPNACMAGIQVPRQAAHLDLGGAQDGRQVARVLSLGHAVRGVDVVLPVVEHRAAEGRDQVGAEQLHEQALVALRGGGWRTRMGGEGGEHQGPWCVQRCAQPARREASQLAPRPRVSRLTTAPPQAAQQGSSRRAQQGGGLLTKR